MTRIAHVETSKDVEIACLCPPDLAIHLGDYCVAEAAHVLEFGRITKMAERDSVQEPQADMPRVLRRATLQDQSQARENELHLKMATDVCNRKVRDHGLDMQIVSVSQSFDRKVVTISFMSEERIQFRDMVVELASELKARIEMLQIGVRDAAGIVGGLGTCGRELCCATWLSKFEAVSVRMAKNQRLSPNPNTISGVCGRLKCCLRYENACYTELARALPRDGATVTCPKGNGCVIDKNVLTQRVRVRTEENNIEEYAVEDLHW